MWADAIYAQVVLGSNFKYLADYRSHIRLSSSLFTDVTEKYACMLIGQFNLMLNLIGQFDDNVHVPYIFTLHGFEWTHEIYVSRVPRFLLGGPKVRTSCGANMKRLLTYCRDVQLRARLARKLGFNDITAELNEQHSYLRDFAWPWPSDLKFCLIVIFFHRLTHSNWSMSCSAAYQLRVL